jgi:hypothetical protein
MKILKKILLGFFIIIGLLLVAGLFMKKDFKVAREITINKSKQEVFNYLKILKNEEFYSTWTKKDPKAIITYSGTDGAVGSISTWAGNSEVGEGEQEIKKIDEGNQIDMELRFKKPMEGVAHSYFTTVAIDSTQTKVTWGMDGEDKYPFNIMQLFMSYDTMIGTEFDAGLKNLKTVLEK